MDSNIQRATVALQDIQADIASHGLDDDCHKQEIDAHEALDLSLKQQEIFLKERCRNKWLAAGDRNTAFFYQQLARKKSKRGIFQLQIDGIITDDKQLIATHVIDFYKNLFRADAGVSSDISFIRSVVPSLVSDDDNASLVRCPTFDEIKTTVFSMDGSSAPGPDGFSGIFYQTFWDLIQLDVCAAVHSFFISGFVTPGMNSSFMVLIPKVEKAIAIEQFRLIVLSNFSFKIVTKILADRLSFIATRIISGNQLGF